MNETTATPATLTHLIQASSFLRYIQHHHRETKKNRTHAVNNANVAIYEGARVETVCGATVSVGYDDRICSDQLNCWKVPAEDAKWVTCKDCRKKLGLPVAKKVVR